MSTTGTPQAGPTGALPDRQEDERALTWLDRVALVEGCSFVVLLVGSALKRLDVVNIVPVMGPLHGVLFVGLVAGMLLVRDSLRWSWPFFLAVATVLSPGAHFALRAERRAREERAAGSPAAPAAP